MAEEEDDDKEEALGTIPPEAQCHDSYVLGTPCNGETEMYGASGLWGGGKQQDDDGNDVANRRLGRTAEAKY